MSPPNILKAFNYNKNGAAMAPSEGRYNGSI